MIFHFYFLLFTWPYSICSLDADGRMPPPHPLSELGLVGGCPLSTLPLGDFATWGLCHSGTLPDFWLGATHRWVHFGTHFEPFLLRNLVHVSNPKQIPGHFWDGRMVKYKWQNAKWQSANGRVPVLKYIAKYVPVLNLNEGGVSEAAAGTIHPSASSATFLFIFIFYFYF